MSDRERLNRLDEKLSRILWGTQFIIWRMRYMDSRIQAIIDQAVANEATEANASATITALLVQIQNGINSGDLNALQATVDQMKASAATLGAAVTSAAGATVPPPAPVPPPA